MSQSQFSLAWDSFKSNICDGFAALQQNAEFVDMTIAADGHLVKVHKVLVALASPYLKDMMSSAPCPHPVIYLNNISHKVLSYLLEYIYTGEVMVPSESLGAFSEAAKSLHIKGLENISGAGDYPKDSQTSITNVATVADSIFTHSLKRKPPQATEVQHQKIGLPSSARKIFIKAEGPISMEHIETVEESHDYTDMGADDTAHDSDDGFKEQTVLMEQSNTTDIDKLKATASNLLFTVSIRGSLQVILNRYIYNLNSTTSRTGCRRWRCVEYRNSKCTAFVVTKGNVVVNRANAHNHPFHDRKILAKLDKKSVFSAFDEVEAYKEKEKELDDKATITEDESYIDDFTSDSKPH